jgi:hypothetical protein
METKNASTEEIIEKESDGAEDFWATHDPDEYKTQSEFLTEEETDELVGTGAVLRITWIDDVEPTEYGLRRVVTFELGDAEVRKFKRKEATVKKSFTTKNPKGEIVFEARGRLLQDMAEYLVANGKPIPVRFFPAGRGVGIEAAG